MGAHSALAQELIELDYGDRCTMRETLNKRDADRVNAGGRTGALPVWSHPRIAVSSGLPLPDPDLEHLADGIPMGTDIGSIIRHVSDIQRADIALLIDDGRLFDIPDTDDGIRSLLPLLSLQTVAERSAMKAKYPQAFETEPLLDPAGYAVQLLSYDYGPHVTLRGKDGNVEWVGTRCTEDPVLQRRRLTEAVARVVCRCFAGGQGDAEQHLWVLLRGEGRPFRSEVLDLLLGTERQSHRWGPSPRVPEGVVAGLCHRLGCEPSHALFKQPPRRDGMLLSSLGCSEEPVPFSADKGGVAGFMVTTKNLQLVWIDAANSGRSDREILSICLRQFGIDRSPKHVSDDTAQPQPKYSTVEAVPGMLPIREAAEYANVSERTVRTWLRMQNQDNTPMIPGVIGAGRLTRIPVESLAPYRKAARITRSPSR
jgi:hypothetical protein